jgi:hypothetical protein
MYTYFYISVVHMTYALIFQFFVRKYILHIASVIHTKKNLNENKLQILKSSVQSANLASLYATLRKLYVTTQLYANST